MGHFWTFMREPTGQPYRAWLEKVPNDGLIWYLDMFNSEGDQSEGSG